MDNKLYVNKFFAILMKTMNYAFQEEDNNDLIIKKLIIHLKLSYYDCLYILFYIFKIKNKIFNTNIKIYNEKIQKISKSGIKMFLGASINAYEYRRNEVIELYKINKIKKILKVDEEEIVLIKNTFKDIINNELIIDKEIFNKLKKVVYGSIIKI